MKMPARGSIASLVLIVWSGVALSGSDAAAPAKGLTPFASEQELASYLAKLNSRRSEAVAAAAGDQLSEIAVTATRTADSITNTQTEGIDEGGIVKLHGNHLVVLRRGRLFTVEIGDQSLRPISWINAYGPGIDPDSTWYDEMLIHGDRIVVIGYSYDRDGTEIALFDIDSNGLMRYDSTYFLSSNDYYSSRNYASRLSEGKLIFYTPLHVSDLDSLPTLRRWPSFMPSDRKAAGKTDAARIINATRIYRPVRETALKSETVLHTITTCELNAPRFSCRATGVLGSSSEVFYVSRTAVYVWIGPSWYTRPSKETSLFYRLPLDGSLPSAMQTFGGAIDQFSFLEHEGYINVLTSSDGHGAWMWNAEKDPGEIALLRAPLRDFGAGSGAPNATQYLRLPKPKENGAFQNRFVGEQLLYGVGDSWNDSDVVTTTLHVVDTRTRNITPVPLDHGVDRIEALGANAIVVGADGRGSLHFSGIDLAAKPRTHRHFALPNAAQAELRSHGFFYSPNTLGGMAGLPIRADSGKGWRHLHENAAGVLFLRIRKNAFEEAGLLSGEAKSTDDGDDGCQASCVDWYGNARPIFLRGRVFGLLGYELVEGRAQGDRIIERRRVDFMPYVNQD